MESEASGGCWKARSLPDEARVVNSHESVQVSGCTQNQRREEGGGDTYGHKPFVCRTICATSPYGMGTREIRSSSNFSVQ